MNTEEIKVTKTGYPSIDKPWLDHYKKVMGTDDFSTPEPMSIYDYIFERNKEHLNQTAIKYLGVDVSYAEFFDKIEQTASALTAMGIKEGDIVTIAMPNFPEVIYLIYALNRIGAVSNNIHPLASQNELLFYIDEVKSKFMFMFAGTYSMIKDVIDQTTIETAVVISPVDSIGAVKRTLYNMKNKVKLAEPFIDWKTFIKKGKGIEAPNVHKDPTKVAVISHTGGTTGDPKGVMLADIGYNNFVYYANTAVVANTRNLRFMPVLPTFVNYSLNNACHGAFACGGTLCMVPQYDPKHFRQYLDQYHPNILFTIPPYVEAMLNDPDMADADVSCFKVMLVGGEAISPELQERAKEYFRTHNNDELIVTRGLGATEMTSGITYTYPELDDPMSVGMPYFYDVVKAVKPGTTEEVKYNEIGELCFLSPDHMIGYYNNKEATDKVLQKHPDGKIWMHMGDLGKIDEVGNVFVTGRIKRIFMTKGKDGLVTKVFPDRIQNTINQVEGVNLSCVVGVKDEKRVYYPKAYIELTDPSLDKEAIKTAIIKICEKELPGYEVPDEIEFMDKLPRTDRDKVDYRALEEDQDV